VPTQKAALNFTGTCSATAQGYGQQKNKRKMTDETVKMKTKPKETPLFEFNGISFRPEIYIKTRKEVSLQR